MIDAADEPNDDQAVIAAWKTWLARLGRCAVGWGRSIRGDLFIPNMRTIGGARVLLCCKRHDGL